jgi:hypothetical protein
METVESAKTTKRFHEIGCLIDNQPIPRNLLLYLIDKQLIPRNLLIDFVRVHVETSIRQRNCKALDGSATAGLVIIISNSNDDDDTVV